MALNNYDLGIRSVTYTTGTDGKPKEVDPVDWTRDDYFVNNQAVEAEPSMEPFAGSAPKRKTRKRKTATNEQPKMVGQDLVEKAHKKDLRRRGLN